MGAGAPAKRPVGNTNENAPNQSGVFDYRISVLLAFPALEHQGGVGAAEAEAVAHDRIDLGVFQGFALDRQVGDLRVQFVDVGGAAMKLFSIISRQ